MSSLKAVLKGALRICSPFLDVLFSPLVLIGAVLFKFIRRFITYFPFARKLFFWIGVFPIRDHYFEPMFNPKHLRHSLRDDRNLPGIDLNDKTQLEILSSFHYEDELLAIPIDKPSGNVRQYYYNNGAYASGDGEYL